MLDAARASNNLNLLARVEGKDLVALEASYHRSCYKSLTRPLTKPKKNELQHYTFNDVFREFCSEIIEKRVIQQKEILRLIQLKEILESMLARKDCDHRVKTSYLKQKLRNAFPGLSFFRPKQNESDIVVHSHESLATHYNSSQSDSETDEAENETDNDSEVSGENSSTFNETRTLYMAANALKTQIKDSQGITAWPPTAHTCEHRSHNPSLFEARNVICS